MMLHMQAQSRPGEQEIRTAQHEAGLTTAQLAASIGMGYIAFLVRLDRGTWTLPEIVRIAKATGNSWQRFIPRPLTAKEM